MLVALLIVVHIPMINKFFFRRSKKMYKRKLNLLQVGLAQSEGTATRYGDSRTSNTPRYTIFSFRQGRPPGFLILTLPLLSMILFYFKVDLKLICAEIQYKKFVTDGIRPAMAF